MLIRNALKYGPGTPAVVLPISSSYSDGFRAFSPSPAAAVGQVITTTDAGFDSNGNAVTHNTTRTLVQWINGIYPNHLVHTTGDIAWNSYLYGTTSILGLTHGSVAASPPPVTNFITPDRLAIPDTHIIGGSSLPVEVFAAHRNGGLLFGKQVACVKYIFSDGVRTKTVLVNTPDVSTRASDRGKVICYPLPATDLSGPSDQDATGLANGLISMDTWIYPWFGDASSINKASNNGTARREFTTRYYAKGQTKYYATLDPVLGTAGGVFSTNTALADATPFDTVLSLNNAINSGAAGRCDNVEVRAKAGTFVMTGAATTRNQDISAITYTLHPSALKTTAIYSFGTAAFRARYGVGTIDAPMTEGVVRFKDITVLRTGALSLQGEATNQLDLIFDDCNFDNGSFNAAYLNNSHARHYGTTFTNLSGASTLGAGTYEHRIFRGCSLQPAFAAAGTSVEGFCIIGCAINNPVFTSGTRSQNGMIIAFNALTQPPTTPVMITIAASADVTSFAIVQNTCDYVSATTNAALRISGDSATGGNIHGIIINNTFGGAFAAGRWNAFYDDGPTRRTSSLMCVKNNIIATPYTKSHKFVGENNNGSPDPVMAPFCTGNRPYEIGVDCAYNWSMFQNPTPVGGNEQQEVIGVGSTYGTSSVVRNDPLFVSYQGTTVAAGPVYTAGAGGSDFRLQAGSPCKNVAPALLSHDFDGTARLATSSIGAFA